MLHPSLKRSNYKANLNHTIHKNHSFLNIFRLLGSLRKDKLEVQAARLLVFDKSMNLHDLRAIERGLHQLVV